MEPKYYKDSSVINLSIACSDEMINDQIIPLLPLLDYATTKICLDTNCMDAETSVVNDEKYVSSNINSCIESDKSNNIQSIFSNELYNDIILKPIPFNVDIQLDTIAKGSNEMIVNNFKSVILNKDCSKTNDHLEIEPMEFESIKSNKKTHDVGGKLKVKEKDVVISKVKISGTYGIFPTIFLFLS